MSDELLSTNKLLYKLKKIKNNKKHKFTFILIVSLLVVSILSIYFIATNENYYKRPMAKITSIDEKKSEIKDADANVEHIKKQQVTAIIMNGSHKGQEIKFNNTTSYSGVIDLDLKVNDKIFIAIKEGANKEIVSCRLIELKRDKYIASITILFVILILLVGELKGFRSLISVIINIAIFATTIKLFLKGYNLTIVCVIASILFTVLSILIVCGKNKKTLAAMLSTVAATIISMIITIIVLKTRRWSGIHFEEMEFLTHSPEPIFIVEVLIGTLGGIMDVAVSIASSMKEIYDKNPNIEKVKLINFGMEVGKDIMGTMANTLVFAYLSGSIPSVVLALRNKYSIAYVTKLNLSLEIIRALIGSIGIVLSIPITVFISVKLLKKYKIGEV